MKTYLRAVEIRDKNKQKKSRIIWIDYRLNSKGYVRASIAHCSSQSYQMIESERVRVCVSVCLRYRWFDDSYYESQYDKILYGLSVFFFSFLSFHCFALVILLMEIVP